MTDLWGFLLQTLTASGAAVLLLIVKALFRDKLTARWQFAVWGVLALVLLFPAGLGGRYVLLNWPLLIEAAKTTLTRDWSLTRVWAPIPLLRLKVPGRVTEWLYTVYVVGVLSLLIRCLISYVRLRLVLRRGTPAGTETTERIADVAARYALAPCRAVEVPGLKTAFLCGVFRPVLALPAGAETDDKVLLHELLHRKYRDTAWGLVICFFRCLHWCNPLLWYCANRAGNDLEERCDQRVLELLEGEERRNYGRILLSMADETYAHTPGATCLANGGKNIKRRIASIARFKLYPAGMGLVSVCVVILLAAPLMLGRSQPMAFDRGGRLTDTAIPLSLARARLQRCTTPAGALDAYAKAVLDQNGFYRAMCAPLAQQEELAHALLASARRGESPLWDPGLPARPNTQGGYMIYNLESSGEAAFEGLLVVELNGPPDGRSDNGTGTWLAVQRVRTQLQEDRWVVVPLEEFDGTQTELPYVPTHGCADLPAFCYEAQAEGFTLSLRYQSAFTVNNWSHPMSSFDLTPQPHEAFSGGGWTSLSAAYTGGEAAKADIYEIGVSVAPIRDGDLAHPGTGNSSGGSTDGSSWGSRSLEPGWESTVLLLGGGSFGGDPENFTPPESYAADLYLNGEKAAELTLLPVEAGAP